MSEPHIIIGPAVGPGGPTVTTAGAFPATASPAVQTEVPAAISTSTVAPDAGITHAAEDARSQAAPGKAESKHRVRAAARTRAAEPDAGDPDALRASSVKAAKGVRAEKESETEPEEETRSERRRAARIAIERADKLLIMLLHVLRALGSRLWGVVVRYPRHSLAALASVLILGGIEYTQWKGAKTPPKVQISGKQAAGGPAGKEPAGSKPGKIATAGPKPAGQNASQGGAALPPSEKPEPATATPVASASATPGPGDSAPPPATTAVSDPPLPLVFPNAQTGVAEAEKTAPAKTETSVVSAPGLMVAASETLPPPASSLAKDGATLLASSPESAPPAPPPVGGKEQAATEAGKSAPFALAPPEPAPAPAPLPAKSENGPEDGNAQKPAPRPAVKQPEPPPAPAPLPLDSVPPPAAKAADSAPVPSPTNPPPASGQTTEVSPLPPIEAAPPATAPAATATEPLPGSSPAPQHDKGSPEVGHDPAKDANTSQSKPGTDTTNPNPEPTPDPGHAPVIEAPAKPKSNDKPELAPSLANPPLGDAPSEVKPTPGSPAALGSGPQDAHKGEVRLVPKLDHEPEPSPVSSQTGEEPVKSEAKPTQTPAPLANASSPQSPDTAAKVKPESSRSDEPAGSPKDRAESHPDSSAPAATETAPPGWVPIRNSGKVPLAAGDEPDPRAAGGDDSAAGSDSIRDSRAHAAKDMSFEMESPRSRALMGDPETDSTRRASGLSGSAAGARRVETVPHVVENRENFWTISRQYYGSGRYYRALWKANADRCPQIDGLRVNDVIVIPPPEDLDPNYIDPPGEHARSPRAGRGTKPGETPDARERRRDGMAEAAETAADSSSPLSAESPSSRRGTAGARTNQRSSPDDGVPIQRSSRTSSALELPAASSDSIFSRDRRSVERRADLAGGAGPDTEPDSRAGRRSRSANSDSRDVADTRPVYKVRPNDTLRSIARDTLGSSRRANEILDLNRDIIDDPQNLIVGQMLELPEDARTSIRRRASR